MASLGRKRITNLLAREGEAAALGMSYVYYPATLRSATGRDFGNAILSNWPISADQKVILPHLGRFAKTQHRDGGGDWTTCS